MHGDHWRGFTPYALAAFLVGLTGGFSAVLGPAFVQDLGLAYNNTTWTALATTVPAAACAPILGKAADVAGRRRMLLGGVLVFGLGNLLTAMADSLGFMLVARVVTGIGMAAIAPVVMAYIVTEFPKEAMGKGFSAYMLISSGAVVFGPTLGTVIISLWGWRAMLWSCTALCAVVLLVCSLWREPARPGQGSFSGFDGMGAVLVVAFFGLLLSVPSFGQNLGWRSGAFRLSLLGAAVSGLALIRTERRAKQPILPGQVLREGRFRLSVAALFLTQGLIQANMTNTIVFVAYTQPDNRLISGYAISAMYLGMALGATVLGPLADRWEPRDVLTLGLPVTAAGCALMLLFTQRTTVLLLLSLGVLGFGLGGNATAFMKAVLSSGDPKSAGALTGIFGLFRDLAAPLGVAVLVPLFTNRIASAIAAGTGEERAAVEAVKLLAAVELGCLAAAFVLVRRLPRIRNR